MTPRERRLLSDLRQMEQLALAGVVVFRAEGSPPETYHVMFNVPGLARDGEGRLVVRSLHRCTLYLHRDYPRRPPVVEWSTPVFHPNLLPPERNGGVCIGSWSAAESLSDLCVRLQDLVSYKSLNANDALDPEAGAWARRHHIVGGMPLEQIVAFAVDDEPLVSAATGGVGG